MTCTCYRCTGHPIDDDSVELRERIFHDYRLSYDELPSGDLRDNLIQELTRRYDAAEHLRARRENPD